jgi:hypothetical protein
MSVLGGGIDKFDVELFGLPGLDDGEESFSNDDGSLAGTDDTTLDHEEILVDFSVMRESTHGGDVLFDGISFAGTVVDNVLDGTSSYSVDLFVHLGSVMVTHLTSSGDCPLDSSGMPSSDTSDLSETSMRFSVKSLDTESSNNTLHTETFSDTVNINALVHLEDIADSNFLFEEVLAEINLIGCGTTVNLDFHNVSFLLSELEEFDLSGAKDTDDRAVLSNSVAITFDGVLVLFVEVVSLSVLGESLLFGVHPVLVHSSFNFLVKVLGPDGGESAEATWCLNVTDHTDDLHWGAFNNGDGVNDILLEHLFTFTSFLILDDVTHTGLVSHEGGKMRFVSGVVTGE